MEKLTIGCVILGAGLAIWLVESSAPKAPPSASAGPEMTVATSVSAPPVPTAVPIATGITTAISELSLASPSDVVATQIALLGANRDDEFRNTFVAAIRDRVTPEAIAACRRNVVGKTVHPDWEVAKSSVEGGQRVVRVSMFGKSMTGFHEETPGNWLADAVWCLPRAP